MPPNIDDGVPAPRASTGIAGLDDILGGGLPCNRLYLIKGSPGVGKTTLSLQFLMEGARAGESVLYITLSETETEIRQVARSHGWTLDGIDLFELSSAEQTMRLNDENTLYAAEDVDLKETVRVLLDHVEERKPTRVVFDSLSEIRLLAQSPVRYRRQLLALKQHFAGRHCTVLLLDDHVGSAEEQQVESLVHGVLTLEQLAMQYGADRRRLRVAKLRGSPFRSGYHDFLVQVGGLKVFPRLIASEHRTEVRAEPISSDVKELDAMMSGGIDRSTCTLLIGPAGCGKSALASQFALAAARRGEHATLFLFEERIGTWMRRGEQLGMALKEQVDAGRIHVKQVDPAELAPDEFAHLVRDAVERDGSRVVVIDSMTGYFTAMPEARFLSLQMHELLGYLSEHGVASVLTVAQSGMIGSNMTAAVDLSYLADTIVVLRYFEALGHLKKAVSVLKKRSGSHEDAIREIELGPKGIRVGKALTDFHGIFTGVPRPLSSYGEGSG
jgi:circadian clock protein KaiC